MTVALPPKSTWPFVHFNFTELKMRSLPLCSMVMGEPSQRFSLSR